MATNKYVQIVLTAKDQASNQIRRIQKAIGNLGMIALGVGVAGLTAFAVVLKKGIAAQKEAEVASNNLAAAMKTTGTYTKKAHDEQLKYASALQKQSLYGDDAITNAQSQLVSLANLSGDGLERATKATLDLAAATGMDLEQAGSLVGKSIGTQTNALSRYGVTVEGAVGSVERLNSFVNNSAVLFGGRAFEATKTFEGKMEQFKNRIGDVLEVVGKLGIKIIEIFMPAMEKGLRVIENIVAGLDEFIKRYEEMQKLAAGDPLAKARDELRKYNAELASLQEMLKNTIQIRSKEAEDTKQQLEGQIRMLGYYIGSKNLEIYQLEEKQKKEQEIEEQEIAASAAKIKRIAEEAEANRTADEEIKKRWETVQKEFDDEIKRIDELEKARQEALKARLMAEIENANSIDAVAKGMYKNLWNVFKETLISQLFATQIAEVAKISATIATHLAMLNFPGAAFAASQLAVPAATVAVGVGSINALSPKLADGGIVLPKTGGTNVIMAEAGEPELALPASKVKAFLDVAGVGGGNGNITNNIYLDGKLIYREIKSLDRQNNKTKRY